MANLLIGPGLRRWHKKLIEHFLGAFTGSKNILRHPLGLVSGNFARMMSTRATIHPDLGRSRSPPSCRDKSFRGIRKGDRSPSL